MGSAGSVSPPRRLVALIGAITVIPLAVFLWLGGKLLAQDRAIEQQQTRDRLQTAADLVIVSLERAIAGSEQKLASGSDDWPAGTVVVTFQADRVEVSPPGRLAFFPVVPAMPQVPVEPFRAAESLEFQRRDRAAAILRYRELTGSSHPGVRAGALLRLARNLKATGRYAEALDTYERLRTMEEVAEAGVPVSLAAAWSRCTLLAEQGRHRELRTEAQSLHDDLASGRWRVAEAVYLTYAADVVRWTDGTAQRRPSELLAAAVARLWHERTAPAGTSQGTRRKLFTIDDQPLVIVWQVSAPVPRALVAAQSFVESAWLKPAALVAADQKVEFHLRDAAQPPAAPAVNLPARTAAETIAPAIAIGSGQSSLPWHVTVFSTSSGTGSGLVVRRRLLIGGFVLLATLSLAASWLILRAVGREMAVARLQSDFVAAVSHEFRTPLTTLRQFTDMLRDHPGLPEERRSVCYAAQARATERLTRLVESVLDFGRMEAGARPYHFESRDCADLVERVVEDFRAQPQAAGYVVKFARNGNIPVDADEEALSRAVWNLLDNAVKYSPDVSPIEVGVSERDGTVSIAVRDHGLGIPARERKRIFLRFQRGEQARTLGIRGTGIGLAMVDQIVRAHNGHVEVESEAGAGSMFTIVLPAKG